MAIISLISCGSTITYQPAINDPIKINSENQLSLLSYNIQAIFGKDESKLDALVEYINTETYDFVVLQELFDEGARDYILSKINREVYKSVVSRVDYESFPEMLFQDAGLFMISKYPQVDLSKISLDKEVTMSEGSLHMILTKELSITTDFLANKSVVGSLHKISDSNYMFLFTTHVQAIGSRRQKRRQYKQIKNFIEYSVHAVIQSGTISSSSEIMVVLTGDFNSDAYDEEDLDRLLTDLGSPRELHSERHGTQKEYTMVFKTFNMYKRFDYIFAYDKIGESNLKRVAVHSINATDVQNNSSESLSDHVGLKASLFIEDATLEKVEFSNKERQAK